MEIIPDYEPVIKVAGDMIINYREKGVVLVKRKYFPFRGHWALPGGHINIGMENTMECAIREAREETCLVIPPSIVQLLGVYSDPDRDPRGHYLSATYYCTLFDGRMRAMDDAFQVGVFPFYQLPRRLAFDHRQIIEDYIQKVLRQDWR